MNHQGRVNLAVLDRMLTHQRPCRSEVRTIDLECVIDGPAEPVRLPLAILVGTAQTGNDIARIVGSRDADFQSRRKVQQCGDPHGAGKILVCAVHFLIGWNFPFATGVGTRIAEARFLVVQLISDRHGAVVEVRLGLGRGFSDGQRGLPRKEDARTIAQARRVLRSENLLPVELLCGKARIRTDQLPAGENRLFRRELPRSKHHLHRSDIRFLNASRTAAFVRTCSSTVNRLRARDIAT